MKAKELVWGAYYGDEVVLAKIKSPKKWGMYQFIENKHKEIIPIQYDRLNFYGFNGTYTAVYRQNKVGFYLSPWSYYENAKESVPCIYEDYERIKKEGNTYLAVQRNKEWGRVDWLTGEEKSEFKYDSTNDLPNPDYIQKRWFNE